jgi:hypothetical protein
MLAQTDSCGAMDIDVCDACRDVGRRFLENIGNPMQNYPPSVLPGLVQIKSLFRYYGVSSNLDIAQVCPEKIPTGQNADVTAATDVTSPDVNLFKFLSQRTGAILHKSCSAAKPMELHSVSTTANNFVVSDFIVINLNARVTGFNTLEPDSDADGLTDNEEEATYGTSPTNPRSNRSP